MVVKKTFNYLLCNVLAAVFPFLLIPFLTQNLSEDEYGRLSLFVTIIMIGNLFSFNMQSFLRKIDVDHPEKTNDYLFSVVSLILMIFGFLLFVTILGSFCLDRILGYEYKWVYFTLVIWFVQVLSNLIIGILEVRGKTNLTGCWNLIFSFCLCFFTYLLVKVYDKGWDSRAYSSLMCAVFIQIPILIYFLHKWRGGKINFKLSSEAFRFGLPLLPITLGGYVLIYSDRFFVMSFLNLSELGIYAVGIQIAMTIKLLNISIAPIWSKHVFESCRDGGGNKLILNIFIISFSMILLSYLASVVLPIILKGFIDEKYHGCFDFLLMLFLVEVLRGGVDLLTPLFTYHHKGYIVSLCVIFIAVLNLTFNFYLVQEYGLKGIIYASILSYMVGILLLFLKSNKIRNLRNELLVEDGNF